MSAMSNLNVLAWEANGGEDPFAVDDCDWQYTAGEYVAGPDDYDGEDTGEFEIIPVVIVDDDGETDLNDPRR